MNIRILIDMNLSPDWVDCFAKQGWQSVHWSSIGDPKASDREIMDWAMTNRHIVFTHDLDFGTMLALTHDKGPSVIQVRGQDVLPEHMSQLVISALQQHEADLETGVLVVIDEARMRARLLPI